MCVRTLHVRSCAKEVGSTTRTYDKYAMAEDLTSDYLDDDDFETLLAAHEEGAYLPSASVIKISVDGEDGDVVTRHLRGQANDALALVRVSSKSKRRSDAPK